MISASAEAITVDAPGGNVTIRGLTVRSLAGGNTLNVTAVTDLFVEHCAFNGGRVLLVTPGDASIYIHDSAIRNSIANGVEIDSPSGVLQVLIQDSRVENNATNGISATSYSGTFPWIVIRNSILAGNDSGIFGTGPSDSRMIIHLSGNTITHNQYGIRDTGPDSVAWYSSGDNILRHNWVFDGSPDQVLAMR